MSHELAGAALMNVFEAIAPHGHEQVVFGHDPETGLRAIIAIHDTTLGPSLGGVRMRPYPTEAAALADVLALSQAMTYKFAAAEIALGGGKSVILGDPATEKTPALLDAFGRFVSTLGGRYIPGIDVGTSQDDLRTIGQVADPVSCIGVDPSPFTALGVFATIRACLLHVTGSAELDGVRVAVQGVGHVGESLARSLAQSGARLVLADIDRQRAERLAAELGGAVVEAGEIVATPCDVLAPCAVGGVVTEETLPLLGCRILAGAANNILAAPELAAGLRAAGITYAPDYVANAGGVILLDVERAGEAPAHAAERCEALGARVGTILARADADGVTTVEAADRLAEARLAEARKDVEGRGHPAAQDARRSERVRRYYELVDSGSLEEMYTLFDEDLVYRRPGYGPLRGLAELRRFYEGERVIADGVHSLRSVVVQAERVSVEGDFTGTLRDGRSAQLRFADCFVFRGDRIIERNTYFDAPLV